MVYYYNKLVLSHPEYNLKLITLDDIHKRKNLQQEFLGYINYINKVINNPETMTFKEWENYCEQNHLKSFEIIIESLKEVSEKYLISFL